MLVHQNKRILTTAFCALTIFTGTVANAQFVSGSDGSDGIFDIAGGQGTIQADPTGLDLDGDGIYNFTTFSIGSGTTAVFSKDMWGEDALIFLTTDDVLIDGDMELNGEDSVSVASNPTRTPRRGGPGGFDGGLGVIPNTGSIPTGGEGPGGGKGGVSQSTSGGGSGGHASTGVSPNNNPNTGGGTYGNIFQQPPIGGSGGGGGVRANDGGDGGGGGGAVLIASSGTVTINGSISADGGSGSFDSGAGAGGGIRIVAQNIDGSGSLSARGGSSAYGPAGRGRIRLETNNYNFSGTTNPSPNFSFPAPVLYPDNGPVLRLVSVDGETVAIDPTGSFDMPDVVIDNPDPVALAFEAENIPVGTVLNVRLVSASGGEVTTTTDPLSGSMEDSTTSATVTIPPAFSKFFIKANW